MKKSIIGALILVGFASLASPLFAATRAEKPADPAAEIAKYILESQLMIYSPSYETLLTNARTLLARFYGRNYEQMIIQISSNSRSSYGLDILDPESVKAAGVDIRKPIAYVHVSNNSGYMLIPVQNKKKAEKFIADNLGEGRPYRFAGGYLIFSENQALLSSVVTNRHRLDSSSGFAIASAKLDFKWDRLFAWIESSYFSAATPSVGIPASVKIPYGFTAFTAEYLIELTNSVNNGVSNRYIAGSRILIRNYSGILSTNQTEYIKRLRDVSAAPKFDILDYITGKPVLVGNIYMNLPMLYRYYSYVDTMNILPIRNFVNDMRDKYRIDVERDLIGNSDGRLKLAIDQYDPEKNRILVYGSMGIKSPEAALRFTESVMAAVKQNTNAALTAFDLFTKTFYHYQSMNTSFYYGIMDNELLFSADYEVLTNLVKNKYENNAGYLDRSAPAFLKDASRNTNVGYFLTVDVQSLFSRVNTGVMLSREFLIGIKEIDIYGNPDGDDRPFGWNTTVEVIFYN